MQPQRKFSQLHSTGRTCNASALQSQRKRNASQVDSSPAGEVVLQKGLAKSDETFLTRATKATGVLVAQGCLHFLPRCDQPVEAETSPARNWLAVHKLVSLCN